MSELSFERSKGRKPTRCILHKVADIPGGVGINPNSLNNDFLLEGTPLAKGTNGLYDVVANATLTKAAATSDTSIEIKKGSHIKIGTVILGATVQSIDRTNPNFDTITLDKGMSTAGAIGAIVGENKIVVGVCGTEKNVSNRGNIFVDCWVIAVVQQSNSPGLSTSQKATIPTLVFV